MLLTSTFEIDLDRVVVNQWATYLGQRSSHSKIIVQTQTLETLDQILCMNHYKCLVISQATTI